MPLVYTRSDNPPHTPFTTHIIVSPICVRTDESTWSVHWKVLPPLSIITLQITLNHEPISGGDLIQLSIPTIPEQDMDNNVFDLLRQPLTFYTEEDMALIMHVTETMSWQILKILLFGESCSVGCLLNIGQSCACGTQTQFTLLLVLIQRCYFTFSCRLANYPLFYSVVLKINRRGRSNRTG